MKKYYKMLSIIVPLVLLLFAGCGDKSVNYIHTTDHIASEPFDYTFDSAAHTGISLDGINSDVQLICETGLNTVSITGVRAVGSDSDADAEEYLQLLTVTVIDTGYVIQISVDQPSDTEWRSVTVDFEITIPSDYDVVIGIVNGSVSLDTLESDAMISTVNGNILFDLIAGECDLGVVNGQISGNTELPAGGTSAFSIVNGVMSIGLPQETSAEFDASVANGNIAVDELTFSNQHQTQSSFSGTLGSGDGTIAMSVVNGTIGVTGY